MKNFGFIYKITNTVNGKIYVGKTKTTIEARFKSHKKTALKILNDGKKSIPLYNAMNLYGIDNFIVTQLEQCAYDVLSDRERYWIETLNARNPSVGYNICKGGEGGMGGPMFKGHKHSSETKKKMSESRKGEQNSNFGNHWTQSEALKKLHSKLSSGENNGMYGKKHTDETKKKISAKNGGRIFVTNGSVDKRIEPKFLDKFLNEGFRRGRTFGVPHK